METETITTRVGDVWADQEGLRWKIVTVQPDGWVWVRPVRSPRSAAIMTNPAWLKVWERQ